MSTILFRSCGGLGNQLYQLFFCELISNRYNSNNIVHFHSTNYERFAEWEVPVELARVTNIMHMILIKLRLPMLLFKMGLNRKGYLKFFNIILIDGYFQHKDFYMTFSKLEIANAIAKIKQIAIDRSISDIPEGILYHFRLGDFFENEQKEMEYVAQNLSKVTEGSTIMSNKDSLFNNSNEIKKILKDKNCQYLNTAHLNAVELLNIFYHYKIIYSNGSSLSYFAATLSSSKVLPISESNNKYQEDSIVRLEGLKEFINK